MTSLSSQLIEVLFISTREWQPTAASAPSGIKHFLRCFDEKKCGIPGPYLQSFIEIGLAV